MGTRRPDHFGGQHVAFFLFRPGQIVDHAGIPGPPHRRHRQHAVGQGRLQHPHDRHRQHQRRYRQEHIGDPHQDIFDPAADIARQKPDGHPDRHRNCQHHHPQHQRNAVSEQNAAEYIAPDQIGAHQIRPAGRLVEIDKIDNGARMGGKGGHKVRQHGRQHHQHDQPDAEQRQRVGQQDGRRPPHADLCE